MSQENVELVRRLYSLRADAASVVRGDFDEIFFDYFDPDVEIVPPRPYPDTKSTYRGAEGLRRWFRQLDEVWDDWRFEAERFFDAGDRVVAFARVSGSAKQSGPGVERKRQPEARAYSRRPTASRVSERSSARERSRRARGRTGASAHVSRA